MLSKNIGRRRTIYALGKDLPLDEKAVVQLIEDCVLHCPTAFNMQSARTVILFRQSHADFWKMVEKEAVAAASSEKKEQAMKNIRRFSEAYATILFYEDSDVVEEFAAKFPLYRQNMETWAMQANGMLEYMIWQVLAENGIGASLQHYTELVETQTSRHFNLPKSWKMVAQMPFGSIVRPAAEKTFLPLADRVKIFR